MQVDGSFTIGSYRVWFGNECDHLYGFALRTQITNHGEEGCEPPATDTKSDPRIFGYTTNDLLPEGDWSVETLVDRHWRRQHHTIHTPRHPFVAGGECAVNGCRSSATCRSMFNIWGEIFFADTCGTCAGKFHLKRIDSFPWKKKPAPLARHEAVA